MVAVSQDALGCLIGVRHNELREVPTGDGDGAIDEVAFLGGGTKVHPLCRFRRRVDPWEAGASWDVVNLPLPG